MTEQYKRSGPLPTKPQASAQDNTIARLEQKIDEQDRQIQDLQKAIRRLKDKLDRHADYLNKR